jgi:hypothetical protein
MALIVASYPDPTDPITPLTNAYAWVWDIGLGMGQNSYWVEIWIHKNAELAAIIPPPRPNARLKITAGDVIVPAVLAEDGSEVTPAVIAPTLAEVFALAAQAQAADPTLIPHLAFKQVIYTLVAQHYTLTPNTVA